MFAKSDLIFYAPEGALAQRLERIREFARPRLELDFVASVVPGQPVKVTWKFNRPAGQGPASVTARFIVDGQPVRERTRVGTSDEHLGTRRETDEIVLPPPLYRIGELMSVVHRLELEVLDDADGRRVARQPRTFSVIRDVVDPSWWRWREGEPIEWKHDYTLSAEFFNGFAFAAIETVSIELYEVRVDDGPLDPCVYGTTVTAEARNAIAPRTPTSFAFTLLKDWEWIAPATFVLHGPFWKTFAYSVAVRLTDQFGNIYGRREMDGTLFPVFCSAPTQRTVFVPPTKLSAGAVAMGAAIDAAALTIAAAAALAGIFTAVLAPGLFAAAGIVYGVAHAAYEQAEDPPQPDENFREPVAVVPLELPAWRDEPALRPLGELLQAAARIFALERARTKTRARMMGARLFNDEAALARHREGYLSIERQLTEAAAAARQALPAVQELVETSEAFDPANLRLWLDTLVRDGFRAEVRTAMLDAGLSVSQSTAIQSMTLNRTVQDVLRANGLFLLPLVENLEAMTRAAQSERETILAGEDPCPPPRTTPRREDDARASEDEEKPRPRRRRGPCCCCCCL